MIDISLEFDKRFLRKLNLRVAQTGDRFNNAMLGKKGRLANKALSSLTREPKSPVYPIRWASIRQRKAFFASRGFGRGIPTQRTGKLLGGWKVLYEWKSDGGSITLKNDVPYVAFVQGQQAQPFHLDTGWVQIDDVVDDFMKETNPVVIKQWLKAGDPFRD